MSKIHLSGESGWALACGSDIETAQHRKDIEAREFVAKHTESPDLYCKRCARVAADMVPTDREEPGSVTFTAAEVEHLRGLVKYLARGWVGGNVAEGLRVLREKVGRD